MDDNDTHDEKASFKIKASVVHNWTKGPRDPNSAFTNYNNSEQAHALHEMRLLKAEHTPKTRDHESINSFSNQNKAPDTMYIVVEAFAIGLQERAMPAKTTVLVE